MCAASSALPDCNTSHMPVRALHPPLLPHPTQPPHLRLFLRRRCYGAACGICIAAAARARELMRRTVRGESKHGCCRGVSKQEQRPHRYCPGDIEVTWHVVHEANKRSRGISITSIAPAAAMTCSCAEFRQRRMQTFRNSGQQRPHQPMPLHRQRDMKPKMLQRPLPERLCG
jgi:hypothetical protein